MLAFWYGSTGRQTGTETLRQPPHLSGLEEKRGFNSGNGNKFGEEKKVCKTDEAKEEREKVR